MLSPYEKAARYLLVRALHPPNKDTAADNSHLQLLLNQLMQHEKDQASQTQTTKILSPYEKAVRYLLERTLYPPTDATADQSKLELLEEQMKTAEKESQSEGSTEVDLTDPVITG